MSGQGKNGPRIVAENRYRSTPATKPTAPKAKKKRKKKPVRKAPRGPIGYVVALFRLFTRLIWGIIWRGTVIVSLIIGAAVVYQSSQLPEVETLVDGRARGSVTMIDRYGQPFAWRGDQFAGKITADTVSPHLKNAVIATEDKRFYWHIGVSPRGIAGAIRNNLQSGNSAFSGSGGSTITQQTAKLLCQGKPFDPTAWETEAAYEADCRRTTLWRKATEAIYAV